MSTQPRTELGTRLVRYENQEAPSLQQTSRERSDRVRSAVEPGHFVPGWGGVENKGLTSMPHRE